jgi:hypothetical protein
MTLGGGQTKRKVSGLANKKDIVEKKESFSL